MAVSRDDLHKFIDSIPEEKLPELKELFKILVGEESISDEEKGEVLEAERRIKNGEYSTFEDVFGDSDV